MFFFLVPSNKGVNPIFPTYGSEFSLSAKFTPPFSRFNKIDYANLGNLAEYKLTNSGAGYFDVNNNWVAPGDYIATQEINGSNYQVKANSFVEADTDQGKVDQKKFEWLEYYKIKFKADWFTKIYGKLVLRSLGEFGFLGSYNQDRGMIPFERFFVGGDGLANFA